METCSFVRAYGDEGSKKIKDRVIVCSGLLNETGCAYAECVLGTTDIKAAMNNSVRNGKRNGISDIWNGSGGDMSVDHVLFNP